MRAREIDRVATVERLRAGVELLGPRFVQIYGLTESTWPVTALRRDEHLQAGLDEDQWLARLGTCGLQTGVGELKIVDTAGKRVEPGTVGEVLVRGRNTMSGYWGVAGVAGAARGKGLAADGWMHTRDLGRQDTEGYLTIVDRLDDMIVSGGFNIYPREVEEALSGHPAVLEAAVVGRPSQEWGETVHACVVLKEGKPAAVEELIRHAGRSLAGYKKPRSLEIIDSLPRNPAGKVLRRELRRGLVESGCPRAPGAPSGRPAWPW